MPKRMQTLSMFRGDYREFPVTVTADYQATAEVHFAAKPKELIDAEDETDVNATVKVEATGGVDNGDGTITFTLIFDESATDDKTPGSYIGEIEYIDEDGKRTTSEHFKFILKGDINQRA